MGLLDQVEADAGGAHRQEQLIDGGGWPEPRRQEDLAELAPVDLANGKDLFFRAEMHWILKVIFLLAIKEPDITQPLRFRSTDNDCVLQ